MIGIELVAQDYSPVGWRKAGHSAGKLEPGIEIQTLPNGLKRLMFTDSPSGIRTAVLLTDDACQEIAKALTGGIQVAPASALKDLK